MRTVEIPWWFFLAMLLGLFAFAGAGCGTKIPTMVPPPSGIPAMRKVVYDDYRYRLCDFSRNVVYPTTTRPSTR